MIRTRRDIGIPITWTAARSGNPETEVPQMGIRDLKICSIQIRICLSQRNFLIDDLRTHILLQHTPANEELLRELQGKRDSIEESFLIEDLRTQILLQHTPAYEELLRELQGKRDLIEETFLMEDLRTQMLLQHTPAYEELLRELQGKGTR